MKSAKSLWEGWDLALLQGARAAVAAFSRSCLARIDSEIARANGVIDPDFEEVDQAPIPQYSSHDVCSCEGCQQRAAAKAGDA